MQICLEISIAPFSKNPDFWCVKVINTSKEKMLYEASFSGECNVNSRQFRNALDKARAYAEGYMDATHSGLPIVLVERIGDEFRSVA